MKSITRQFTRSPISLHTDAGYKPFWAMIFGVKTLNVCDYVNAVDVLVEQDSSLSGKAGNRSVAQCLFGSSVLYEDGDPHQQLRLLLEPLFEFEHGKLNEATAKLTVDVATDQIADGPVRVLEFFRNVTIESICRSFLGIRLDHFQRRWLSKQINDLGIGLYGNVDSVGARSRVGRALSARNRIDLEISKHFPNAFSENLRLRGLAPSEILDQATTLLFAGVDTTSSTLTFALNNILDLGAVGELGLRPIINSSISNALYKFPPVYFIPRGAIAETEVAGQKVRKGDNVNVLVLGVHSDPAKLSSSRPYVTFGLGKKRCPGEVFAVLTARCILDTLFSEFQVHLARGDVERLGFMPGLHPSSSPIMRLKPRR